MSPRARRWSLLTAWVLVLVALGMFVQRSLVVGTDLRSFMPPPQTPDQKLIMEQIGDGPGSRLLLLAIDAADEARAAELSRGLVAALHLHLAIGDRGGFPVRRVDALAELAGAEVLELAAGDQRAIEHLRETHLGVRRARRQFALEAFDQRRRAGLNGCDRQRRQQARRKDRSQAHRDSRNHGS